MIVHNKADRFLHVAGTKLFPGVNHIADELWAEVKKALGARVGKDIIEVLKDSKAVDLVKLPAGEAEALVKECLSVELLEDWKAKETRDSIRLAIMNQIEDLKKPISKPAEK